MADTRAGFWLLAAVVAITVVAVVIRVLTGDAGDHTFQSVLAYGLQPAAVLLPVVGILLVTSEWSQRTGLITFTLTPVRSRVLVAKLLASVVLALAMLHSWPIRTTRQTLHTTWRQTGRPCAAALKTATDSATAVTVASGESKTSREMRYPAVHASRTNSGARRRSVSEPVTATRPPSSSRVDGALYVGSPSSSSLIDVRDVAGGVSGRHPS